MRIREAYRRGFLSKLAEYNLLGDYGFRPEHDMSSFYSSSIYGSGEMANKLNTHDGIARQKKKLKRPPGLTFPPVNSSKNKINGYNMSPEV